MSDKTGQTNFNTAPLRNQQAMWHITRVARIYFFKKGQTLSKKRPKTANKIAENSQILT